MQTVYFTSITANYLAKARVLCKTLKEKNPDSVFVLGMSDELPDFVNPQKELFDKILYMKDLDDVDNQEQFRFKHTITELCTAVKPLMAKWIVKNYNANVIYLDPDIAVFNKLEELEGMFQKGSILLTPHQLKPEREDLYKRENEILFLKRGSYNFGFFGVANNKNGTAFLDWWSDRLINYCFDDNYEVYHELSRDGLIGLFTDQKWADLIPSYFEDYYIIREPGYNVCTWNLSGRHVVQKSDVQFTVNDKPLYFFHFSGFDSGAHINELRKSLTFYPENKDVEKLSIWYQQKLSHNGQEEFGKIKCGQECYTNGESIQNFERKIFHIRKDIYSVFNNPYLADSDNCYYNWVRTEYPQYFSQKQEKGKFTSMFPYGSKRREKAGKLYRSLIGK